MRVKVSPDLEVSSLPQEGGPVGGWPLKELLSSLPGDKVARVMRMKASVSIVAVAVVALLATAGLVSVAFYVGNTSELPEQLGGMPQDPVMAKALGSSEFEINAMPLEEFRDGNKGDLHAA